MWEERRSRVRHVESEEEGGVQCNSQISQITEEANIELLGAGEQVEWKVLVKHEKTMQ
jgi:hypothetical protein